MCSSVIPRGIKPGSYQMILRKRHPGMLYQRLSMDGCKDQLRLLSGLSRSMLVDLARVRRFYCRMVQSGGTQSIPLVSLGLTLLFCSCAVLGLWLLVSLVYVRRFFRLRKDALATMSVAFVPALVCEGLLIVLSFEPSIPQPFPYSWQWASFLLVIVGASFILLGTGQGLHARSQYTQLSTPGTFSFGKRNYPLVI